MLLRSTHALAFVLLASAVGCGGVSRAPIASPARPDGGVHVRVEATGGVELWQASAPPERVCVAPCESDLVTTGRRFEARVIDAPDSPSFDLPASSKGLVLKVEPAPRVLFGLGVVTGTVGTAGMLIGGALALGDALGGNDDLEGAALGGGITAAAGSAVLAAGIVLIALSGTSVQIREALRAPPAIRF